MILTAYFGAMGLDRPDAIMISDALTATNRKGVIDFANGHPIPAMFEFTVNVKAEDSCRMG
jgi:hypothetical protein